MSITSKPSPSKHRDRGRRAKTPIAIPWRGWRDIFYRLIVGFNDNRILLTAAGVTFFLLFALVPSLSLFVSSYGLLNDPAGVIEQLNLLEGVVPSDGLEIIREQLVRLTSETNASLGLALLVSFGLALWGASAGIKAFFEAMNIVYGEKEKRSFIRINVLALGFVLGALVMLVVMLGAVLVMPVLLNYLALGRFEWLVRLGSYAIMLATLVLALSAIYRWGPSRQEARWRWVTPGSLFATFGIMAMSAGFSWYAANFSNYNATYGSLGALIGLLTWIWFSVTIAILGGALNSELEHQMAIDSTTGEPAPLGERGAYVADTLGDTWPASEGKGSAPSPAA